MTGVHILRRAKVDGVWRWATLGRIPRGTEVRWVVRWRPAGRDRVRHGGTFTTRTAAEARARWIETELAAGRWPDLTILEPVPAETITSLAVLAAYVEARRRRVGAARLKQFGQVRAHLAAGPLGTADADTLTTTRCQAWVDDLPLAHESVRMHLGVLRAAWRHHGATPNPWAAVHPPTRADRGEVSAPRWLEWQAINDGSPRRHRAVLITLEGTGLRVGELEAMTWGDVDLAAGALIVRSGKTASARRRVPISAAARDAIQAQCPLEDRDPDAPVFAALRVSTLRGVMRRACVRAGIPAYSPHDLRHRFASRLVAAGVPLPLAVEIFGHANPVVFLRTYAHVLTDEPAARLAELRADVAALYGLDGTQGVHGDDRVMPDHLTGTSWAGNSPANPGVS